MLLLNASTLKLMLLLVAIVLVSIYNFLFIRPKVLLYSDIRTFFQLSLERLFEQI